MFLHYKLTSDFDPQPRPKLVTKDLEIGNINRLEIYTTENRHRWYQLWRPKRQKHLLGITDNAIYDLCERKTDKCKELFSV